MDYGFQLQEKIVPETSSKRLKKFKELN